MLAMQRGSASSSAAELSGDESSDSGSHAGHLVRARPMQPTHTSDSEVTAASHGQHANSDSLSSDSAAGAREGNQSRLQGQLATPQRRQKASSSSSGWSSSPSSEDDDETADDANRAGGTRHMAQSMLAALAALHHRSVATRSAAAAVPHHTLHQHTPRLAEGDARPQPRAYQHACPPARGWWAEWRSAWRSECADAGR